MLILEAFCAKEYPWPTAAGLTKVKVNIPALFPLKAMNDVMNVEAVSKIYLNNLAVSNTVNSQNFLELPVMKGTSLPDSLAKGAKFMLISADANPLNGYIILA